MSLAIAEPENSALGAMMVSLACTEGSAAHPYLHSAMLNVGPLATRNLADALHLLSTLHGPQPGLIERVAATNLIADADLWLMQAAAGFAAERAYLTQLIIVAGPPPSTPGEAESASAVMAQRHALETMATSERYGCAIGAAAGLTLDWQVIRAALDTAALRLGVAIMPCALPSEDETAMMLEMLPPNPRLDRTLAFGACQLLVQHCGLWELLQTRASARGEF